MKKAIAAVLLIFVLSACSAAQTFLSLPSASSQVNAEEITSFSFSNSNIFYTVEYEVSKDDLVAHFSYGYEHEPDVFSEKNWDKETWGSFVSDLSECGVCNWQGEYVKSTATDADLWTLELAGDSGTNRITGSNGYPPGWRSFMYVLNKYFGSMEDVVPPSPSPSSSPTPEISATPEPLDTYDTEAPPFSGFIMEPNDSTVVIADASGTVLFGYSDGRWLTHSQAAAYCGEDMDFYSISMGRRKDSVSSSGAEQSDEYYDTGSSVNNDYVITYDSNNDIILKLEGKAKGFICHIDPERIPDFEIVEDYSSILPLLQPLIDEQFGEGNVIADITYAVQAEIDGDGEKETIVNASNLEGYDRYESEESEEGYWYSILCAIEPDGSFTFIQDSYNTGFKEEARYNAIRGIADVNGDGICEFLTEVEGWEYWGKHLCLIEDNKLIAPMIYDWVS